MSRRRTRTWIVAAVALIAIVATALWLGSGPERAAGPSAAPGPPSASPTPGSYRLVVHLGRVSGRAVRGSVHPHELRRPAAAVRGTMTTLYADGFVDTSAWDGGAFPSIFKLFAGAERPRAHRDLAELTLGRAARQLDAVRPNRARLTIRFLTNAAGHPSVAVADVDFVGTGFASSTQVPIRQEGEFTLRQVNGPWRIVGYRVRSHVPSALDIRRKVAEAASLPMLPSRRPIFFLVIGSDARPGQSVIRSRGDSLHIVGVNPSTGAASIVGIPRDSYVPIPGHGTNKINTSLYYGGPELTVQTVERLTGIHLSGYILTGFRGFEQIVRTVGRISIRIPYDIADHFSHAFFKKGPTKLNAREALAFNRNRHDAPGGDFGRSLNQGRFLIAALAQLRADLRSSSFAFAPWAVAAARYLVTNIDLPDLFDLLLAAPSIDPARVKNRVVSGHGATIGGSSVVILDAGAFAIFRDLRGNATLNH